MEIVSVETVVIDFLRDQERTLILSQQFHEESEIAKKKVL